MYRMLLLLLLFPVITTAQSTDSIRIESDPKPYLMVRGATLIAQPDYQRGNADAYQFQVQVGTGIRFNRQVKLGIHSGLILSHIAPMIPLTGEFSLEAGKGRFAPLLYFQAGGVVPLRRNQPPGEGPWGWGQTIEVRGGGLLAMGAGISVRRDNREALHFTAGFQGYETSITTRWNTGSDRQLYDIRRWALQASWFFW